MMLGEPMTAKNKRPVSSQMAEARSTIVIPNYNGISYIKACLDSIFADSYPVKVILVDNGSTDGSAELLREYERLNEIHKCIFLPDNKGFCKAVNAGIKACDTKYVILLNNDVTVEPGFVRELEKTMEEHADAFSANAQMRMMKNPKYMDNAGDYYCALGWAFDYGKGKPVSQKYQKPRRIFASCGGASIYRCSVFEEIGYFDEAHFAYLEDIDIGYRARIAGYYNYYQPAALVYHAGSSVSGSQYNEFKINLSSRNSIYIIRKNMPGLQIILNFPLLIAGFAIKTLFFAKKGYGKIYLKGLKSGFKLYAEQQKNAAKKDKKVHVQFKWKNLPHYIRIQLELWWNIVRRCLG